MSTNETTVIGIRVRQKEREVIAREASKHNLTPTAFVFAILYKFTDGFKTFEDCLPEKMPRNYNVRIVESEVTE